MIFFPILVFGKERMTFRRPAPLFELKDKCFLRTSVLSIFFIRNLLTIVYVTCCINLFRVNTYIGREGLSVGLGVRVIHCEGL